MLGSCFPLPLGGEGQRHQKKHRDEDASTLPDLVGLLYLMLDVCIKKIARFFSFVALPTLPADASWFTKKPHTRDATSTPPHCRQWSNQMLFPCGALLAVHDGLNFAVRVSGRFLRSAVFLCIA